MKSSITEKKTNKQKNKGQKKRIGASLDKFQTQTTLCSQMHKGTH